MLPSTKRFTSTTISDRFHNEAAAENAGRSHTGSPQMNSSCSQEKDWGWLGVDLFEYAQVPVTLDELRLTKARSSKPMRGALAMYSSVSSLTTVLAALSVTRKNIELWKSGAKFVCCVRSKMNS